MQVGHLSDVQLKFGDHFYIEIGGLLKYDSGLRETTIIMLFWFTRRLAAGRRERAHTFDYHRTSNSNQFVKNNPNEMQLSEF